MARVSQKDKAKAFQSNKATTAINNAIDALCKRVKRTLPTPTITHREMLQLIAPAEHIEFLLHGRRIADVGRYVAKDSGQKTIAHHRGKDVAVEFGVAGHEDSPLMPAKTLWLDWFPENHELAMELERCAHMYADVSIDWGLVKTVFKYLNNHCSNPQQIYYLWPCLSGIMSVDEDLDGLRREIVPRLIPQRLPKLPPEVRALCRTTAATVAMALLLPPLELEASPRREVDITFNVDSGGTKVCEDVFTYPL